jgi:beta-lactamase regulating signal transducer with metallopeptidase domain/Flp pilus assembly protein TadD
MIAHLWLATATAAVGIVLVVLLRGVSARIRFAILLLATLRFAIPTPWLTAAGEALAACMPSRVVAAQVPSLEGLLRPGAVLLANTSAPASSLPVLEILWLAGALVSLALWLRCRTAVSSVRTPNADEAEALRRASVRMNAALPELKIAAAGFTPGASGLWRQEVVLPDGLSAELSADELESVCAHELAHIRRRDNLSAAISRIIAAAFWFHPLVWWMDRRMRAERELACDEMVVASGPQEAYATALSKVCLAAGTAGSFAGMAGPNLTQRLERIMTTKFSTTGRGLRSIPATLALLAMLLPVAAGFVRAQGPSRAGDALYQSAESCYKQQDFTQAEVLFRRMIAEYPSDPRGTIGLASVYEATQRSGDSVLLVQQAAEKNPSVAYRLAAGNTLVRFEQYAEAIIQYQKALKLVTTPEESGKVYFAIGETYRRMGRLDDALAAFRRSKEFLNQNASLQIALVLDGTGRPDQAEREYAEILDKEPNHPVALNNLAYRLSEREDQLDKALDYAQRAQKAAPESPDIADTVGWIYLKKKMPVQAEPVFLQIAGKYPDSPLYRQHLAAALDLKGEWTADRRELRTLLDTASRPEQLARLQQLLRAVQ